MFKVNNKDTRAYVSNVCKQRICTNIQCERKTFANSCGYEAAGDMTGITDTLERHLFISLKRYFLGLKFSQSKILAKPHFLILMNLSQLCSKEK